MKIFPSKVFWLLKIKDSRSDGPNICPLRSKSAGTSERIPAGQKRAAFGRLAFWIATTLAFSAALCFAESMNEEHAVLGGGCFWCVEAVYEQLPGIKSVVSGYAAGKTPNPTYEEICTGETGHAEVVKISFDPSVIS